jgi:hypothetical protein
MESLKVLAMRELIKNVIHEEGYEIIEKKDLDSVVEVARFLKHDYQEIQNNVRFLIQKVDLVEHKLNLLLAKSNIRNEPVSGQITFPMEPRSPVRFRGRPRPPP